VKHLSGPNDFQHQFGLSDPVMARLVIYADLLGKWQKKINLVGSDTIPDLWHRHMADSAQLMALIPKGAKRLVDLGSGAGFPGMVLSIIGQGDVHLVESDQRKAVFLQEVARVTETAVTIHINRAEAINSLKADVITARALAPLVSLIPLALPHMVDGGVCLFLKGKQAEDELTRAKKEWIMSAERVDSLTDPQASILILREVKRDRN
jgi:16S rRNA (guanine527-N7)-methyltransferase